MNTEEKQTLAYRFAVIAGIFSAIVSIIMLLNYWQLLRSDPVDNELLTSLVEQLKKDSGNEQLKQDIRSLDLIVRKAYFTEQWQIRAGAYMLIAGVVVLVFALRKYYTYEKQIEVPGSEDRHLGKELLVAQKWIVYSVLVIFGLALAAAYLSDDQLSSAYILTETVEEETEPEVQEIAIRTKEDDVPETSENAQPEETGLVSEEVAGSETTADEGVSEDGSDAGAQPADTPATSSAKESLRFMDQFPSFRGPNGLGISYHKDLPTDWDGAAGRNVLWKSEIPLHGYNSPVIWGDKLFLTGASNSEQFIFCYNRNDGSLIWEHAVNDVNRASSTVPRVTDDTGYAAPTVATDGTSVCAIYATGDVACVDLDGNRKWAKNLGVPDNHYGHSSSLLIHKGLLMVQFDTNKQGKVLALDVASGEQKWETARSSKISWASPIIADMGDHFELVLSSSPHVAAYNPMTGKLLWEIECMMGEVGPSPAFEEGMVFATNEYAVLAAIKPGNPPQIVWESNEYLPEVASPVVDDGMLFLGTSYGVICCYDAANGEILWEYECDDGIYASPMIGDNKVYFLDMGGKMHIFSKDRTMNLIGEPELGERSVSTPSFSNGRIYIRSESFLYCIGK